MLRFHRAALYHSWLSKRVHASIAGIVHLQTQTLVSFFNKNRIRKGVRLDKPGVEVVRTFRSDGRESEEAVKMELKRVLVSTDDKERVIAFQKQ